MNDNKNLLKIFCYGFGSFLIQVVLNGLVFTLPFLAFLKLVFISNAKNVSVDILEIIGLVIGAILSYIVLKKLYNSTEEKLSKL